MRGERTYTRRGGVLDTVMLVSVGVAIVAFGVWFFGFAGSSMPANDVPGRRPTRRAESPACT